MEPRADENRLLAVAASVSDGTGIDWDDLLQEVSTDEAAVVEQLRVLAALAGAHAGMAVWGSLSIVELLGQGSFGAVYRAWDPDLQRDVALKVIRPRDNRPFEPEHAVNEARRLARVRHPNVVSVFGAERRGDDVGVAMEFIKGVTLHALVASRGPSSATEAMLIGLDICAALAAVHAAGLLHGDIKSQNVMRAEGGRIVLMDLGAARDLTRAPAADANDFAGTPLYVAPEVFRGVARSRASDIYSLGVLLYYLATGTYPIDGDTRTQIGRRHRQPEPRRRLRDVRPDLPEAFIEVVERALAEEPEQRYESAGAFEAALRGALGRKGRSALQIGRPFFRTAASVLVVIALGGLSYWGLRGASPGPTAPVDRTTDLIPSGAPQPGAGTITRYSVDAAVYRADARGPVRLASGARVAPGDRMFVEIRTSIPTYTYVVNEDERGTSLLMFPLPGQASANPLAAGRIHRLPGVVAGEENYWEVSTAGGREYFLIFVTPERLPSLDAMFDGLPSPSANMPIAPLPIPRDTVNTLRSVGGIAPAARAERQRAPLSEQFTTLLSETTEQTEGLWVRKAIFDNPEP